MTMRLRSAFQPPPLRGAELTVSVADLCHPIIGRPFTREGWLFELKHDGFRAFVRNCVGRPVLLSRSGRNLGGAFPEVLAAIDAMPRVVLDAELVLPTVDGRSDFQELRRRSLLQRSRMVADAAARRPAVLVVFDLLSVDGEDLRAMPLRTRKERLQGAIQPVRGVQVIQAVPTHGEALFASIVDQDYEGIVAKRMDAPYRSGRQPSWVKIKNKAYSRRGAVEWQG